MPTLTTSRPSPGPTEVEEGEEAETHTVEVTVKGIKVRNTPELTDELVKSYFGFDSTSHARRLKIEIEQDKDPASRPRRRTVRLRSRRASAARRDGRRLRAVRL